MTMTDIPLSKLHYGGDIDSRSESTRGIEIERLANSISQLGLILPLSVIKNGDGGYKVIDGNRRLAALRMVVGDLGDADLKVPCLIQDVPIEMAREQSLAANIERVPLHPMDQWEAFARIGEDGRPVAAIAAHFGVTERMVKQRMALGSLCDEARRLYREEEIDDGVAQQLTRLSHEQQEELLYSKEPKWKLRQIVHDIGKENALSPTCGLAKFVGVEAYRMDGGTFVPDLFAEEGEEMWANADVAHRIAREKVRLLQNQVLADGWQFFEVAESWVGNEYVVEDPNGEPAELTAEHSQRINDIEGRIEEINTADNDDENYEYSDKEMAELNDLEEEMVSILNEYRGWSPKQKAELGVVLGGNYELYYGCRRREGMKPKESKEPMADAPGAEKPLSNALVSDLDAHLTRAVQAVIAKDGGFAMRLLALHCLTHYVHDGKTAPVYLRLGVNFEQGGGVLETLDTGWDFVKELLSGVRWGHAKTFEKQMVALGKLELGEVCAIIAYFIGRSLRAHHRGTELVQWIEAAGALKIREHFVPDTENYFGRLNRKQLMATLDDMGLGHMKSLCAEYKKDALAKYVAEVMPADWIPEAIRPEVTKKKK